MKGGAEMSAILRWLIKRLVLLWDRRDDKLALSFSGGERKDYSILVTRYYDDHFTVGTAEYPYPKEEQR